MPTSIRHTLENLKPSPLHNCAETRSPAPVSATPPHAIFTQQDILSHIISKVPPTQWPALSGVARSFRQAVQQQPVAMRLQKEHGLRLPKDLQGRGLAIYLRLKIWEQKRHMWYLPCFATWNTTPSAPPPAPLPNTPLVKRQHMQTFNAHNQSPDHIGLKITFPDAPPERRVLNLVSRNYEPRARPPWWRACYSPLPLLHYTSIQLESNCLGDMIGTLDTRGQLSLWDISAYRHSRVLNSYSHFTRYNVPVAQLQNVQKAKNLTLQLTNTGIRLSLDASPQQLHLDVPMWPQI